MKSFKGFFLHGFLISLVSVSLSLSGIALATTRDDAEYLLDRSRISFELYESLRGNNPPYLQDDYFSSLTYSEFQSEPVEIREINALTELITLGNSLDPARFSELLNSLDHIVIKPYNQIPHWEFGSAGVVFDNYNTSAGEWDHIISFYYDFSQSPDGMNAEVNMRALPLLARELAHMWDVDTNGMPPNRAIAEEYQFNEQIYWMELCGFENNSISRTRWLTARIHENDYNGLAAQYVTGNIFEINPDTGQPYTFDEAYLTLMSPYLKAEAYLAETLSLDAQNIKLVDVNETALYNNGQPVDGYMLMFDEPATGASYEIFTSLDGGSLFFDGGWIDLDQISRDASTLLDVTRITENDYDTMLAWPDSNKLPADYQTLQNLTYTPEEVNIIDQALNRAIMLDEERFTGIMSYVDHVVLNSYDAAIGIGSNFPMARTVLINRNLLSMAFEPVGMGGAEPLDLVDTIIMLFAHEATHIADLESTPSPTMIDFMRSEVNAYTENAYWVQAFGYANYLANQYRFIADRLPDDNYDGIISRALRGSASYEEAMKPLNTAFSYIESIGMTDPEYISSTTSTQTFQKNPLEGYSFVFEYDGSLTELFVDTAGVTLHVNSEQGNGVWISNNADNGISSINYYDDSFNLLRTDYRDDAGRVNVTYLTVPDNFDMNYFQYLDEDFLTDEYGINHGRVFVAGRADGSWKVVESYFVSTNNANTVHYYAPDWSHTRTDNFYSSGNIKHSLFVNPYGNGFIEVEYFDGNTSDDEYGNSHGKVYWRKKSNGWAVNAEFHPGTDSPSMTHYYDSNWTHIKTNEFYFSGNIRHTFLVHPDDDGFNEIEYYDVPLSTDEYGNNYGRVHWRKGPSGWTVNADFYTDTDQVKTMHYYDTNWNHTRTDTFYSSGNVESTFLVTSNENGERAFEYKYYLDSNQVHFKYSYTDAGRTNLYGIYEYAEDGTLIGFTPAENSIGAELASKQEALDQNQAEFTGTSPEENFSEGNTGLW